MFRLMRLFYRLLVRDVPCMRGGEADLDALVRRGSGHSGGCAVGVVAAGVGKGPACEIIETISQSTTLV